MFADAVSAKACPCAATYVGTVCAKLWRLKMPTRNKATEMVFGFIVDATGNGTERYDYGRKATEQCLKKYASCEGFLVSAMVPRFLSPYC